MAATSNYDPAYQAGYIAAEEYITGKLNGAVPSATMLDDAVFPDAFAAALEDMPDVSAEELRDAVHHGIYDAHYDLSLDADDPLDVSFAPSYPVED